MANLEQVLTQLKPLHLPEKVSWWPPASGWYFLAIITAILIVVTMIYLLHHWQRHRTRHLVLEELIQLQASYERQHQVNAVIIALSTLLRRSALVIYPRQDIAGLSGQAWLQFLDDTGQTKDFSQGSGRLLISAPYQQHPDVDLSSLFPLIRQWINRNL